MTATSDKTDNSGRKERIPPGFLSRFATVKCTRGELPHWEHPGVAVFVTLRLGDSLPQDKLGGWQETLDEWNAAHPEPRDEQTEREFSRFYRQEMERWLDKGYGAAVFSAEGNRTVVEEALRFYDGKRYTLYAYVVMPNHIHLLMMPNEGETIAKIMRSLKHFISVKLASAQTWEGKFWQNEYWDTLIRDVRHFDVVRAYIRGNCPALAYDAYDAG